MHAVAGWLERRDVGPGDLVAVRLPRSPLSAAAVYGIALSGAGYVPIEPENPEARVRAILDDCRPKAVLDEAALDKALRSDAPERLHAARPDDVAYVLYTSGSTGRPKGVVHTHRSALAFVRWALGEFRLGPRDRVANLAPLQFDLSVFDLFAARAAGAELHVVPPRDGLFPSALASFLKRRRVTVFYTVPSVLAAARGALARPAGAFPDLRLLLSAGEPLHGELARAWQEAAPKASLYNLYGPTETNVCAFFRVPRPFAPAGPVPIGRAAAGARLVLARGELRVSGPALMRGYLGGAEARAVYRTGDRAEKKDGLLYFRGRRDGQVKVRGRRVELGEVESALRAHPAVAQAAVAPEGGGLSAFVVPRRGARVSELALRRALAERLPGYMVPSRVAVRRSLPSLPSGKLDRRRLA